MSQINVVEFAGMAGSGKTFLASSLQPFLMNEDLKAIYLVHGPLTYSTRFILYCKKLFYSFYLFLIMPRTAILLGVAIVQAHPPMIKRLISIIWNVYYKVGFILYSRGTVVLDEGLIHAIWSVYLFGNRFPYELYMILSEIIRRYEIKLIAIQVKIEPNALLEQFIKRSTVLKWRHDLAPGGQVDIKAFKDAERKYQEIMKRIGPVIDRTFGLANKSGIDSTQLAAYAKAIVEWVSSASSKSSTD